MSAPTIPSVPVKVPYVLKFREDLPATQPGACNSRASMSEQNNTKVIQVKPCKGKSFRERALYTFRRRKRVLIACAELIGGVGKLPFKF